MPMPKKGDRHQVTVRPPESHWDRYADAAAQFGIRPADYVVLAMAAIHDLDLPRYLAKELAAGQQRLHPDLEFGIDAADAVFEHLRIAVYERLRVGLQRSAGDSQGRAA